MCLVFDRQGRIAGRAYSEFEQHFPRPGWVEHDAAKIWEVTRDVASRAIADAGIDGASLEGIGITNQRETVVAWDRESGEPVHNPLVWQDRRPAARCDELREAGHETLVSARSTRGSASSSRGATSPTTRTRRGRCSSTSGSCGGTRSSAVSW